ncbi:MAG: glycogen synthase [Methanosarcinales archaeon]|nr:glycogen synthase [ANME-2 cluster archaeon]MDF1530820.1 glycogen synthase [ANME-2 cluster archaeon]MDW7776477.1 glycogen synthase [Methanosarcinales archaeon]
MVSKENIGEKAGGQNWIILAGEEAGPISNKMGGIWNVIDSEAVTMARLLDSGEISQVNNTRIIVAGPYYGFSGADWNTGLDRITDLSGYGEVELDGELETVLRELEKNGIKFKTSSRMIGNYEILYLLFDTCMFNTISTLFNGQEMTLSNKVKREAYELIELNSLQYETTGCATEYTHYLNLSFAISEFIRILLTLKEKDAEKYQDEAISEFALSLTQHVSVSLHCHEFGVFYTIARLEKMGLPIRTVATFHATIPGRTAGYRAINKIQNNDARFDTGVNEAFAKLESLASYADAVTAVGDSTRKEVRLFYGIDSILVRNGIETIEGSMDWDNKELCRKRIQEFLSDNLYKHFNGEKLDPEKILPLFTISRIELENKGYPDLLDALVVHDRLIKNHILSGTMDDDVKVVCLLITAHGPKNMSRLQEGFPINLPDEILDGEELRLNQMIQERNLQCENLSRNIRSVAACLYPQWIGPNDGGLNMTSAELMSGCVAGIFPSKYDPFLLTGLEAGAQATPSIVSRVCGFSDALKTLKRLVVGMGGVVVVDNINLSSNETVVDYALAMDYFTSTYIQDKVKYNLLCREAFQLAREMNWNMPAKRYYEILTGIKSVQ